MSLFRTAVSLFFRLACVHICVEFVDDAFGYCDDICRILHLKLDLLLITELPPPPKLAIQKLVLKEESKLILAIK